MRQLYLARRDALVDALTRDLGDLLQVDAPQAGLHLAAWLTAGTYAPTVTRQTAAHGLRIPPLFAFSVGPLSRDGLLLGFATASPDELRQGVQRLARALRTP